MRHPLDRYDSPRWMMDTLRQFIPVSGTILEPCYGSGHWVSGLNVISNDINPDADSHYHLDATDPRSWIVFAQHNINWVITNPPFNQADPILWNALESGYRVAFLLRAAWEEPTATRYPILKKYPYSAKISMPRYCFTRASKTGKWQTDSCTCHWFVWGCNPGVYTVNAEEINKFSTYTRNPDEESAIIYR